MPLLELRREGITAFHPKARLLERNGSARAGDIPPFECRVAAAVTKQEVRVLSTIRKCVLAVGAAGLISAQAASAAPLSTAPTVDPLIALSALGTTQSRAAVCGNGATCPLPMTMTASATSTASASPAVAAAAAPTAARNLRREGDSTGIIWIFAIGGAMVLAAALVAALAGDDDDEPVSPA